MYQDTINNTPNLSFKDGRTPMEAFGNTTVTVHPRDWHHFGCPAYVLDGVLQSETGIFNKWKERAKAGVYLGRSPQHARSVALVLSLTTDLVSPQFHVKFDPSFHTTKKGKVIPRSKWQIKCGFVKENGETTMDAEDQGQEAESAGRDLPPREQFPTNASTDEATAQRPTEGEYGQPPSEGEIADSGGIQQPSEGATADSGETDRPSKGDSADSGDATGNGSRTETGSEKSTRSRYGRHRKAIQRLTLSFMATMGAAKSGHVEGEIFSMQNMFPHPIEQHPLREIHANSATTDPDVMYLHEAMKAPDKDKFVEAMDKEISGQVGNKNFSIILRSDMPEGATLLPAVWAMRRKRRIATREVYKWKARLNIDGSKQVKGRDYDETYAPVASWASIRMLLVMSIIKGWHTRQLDYVMAYPQAPVERDVYMEIPKGYKVEGGNAGDHVLKVHKNIYGQKQAGKVWNDYLVKKLIAIGFVQSRIDPCLFFRGRTLYALYTDDSILASPCNKEIEQIMKDMKGIGLDITDEGDVSDFLGVKIDKQEDGSIHMSQPQLIDSILKDLQLDHETTATKRTPMASSKILFRHSSSASFNGHFHYRQVIGKLNYLEKNSRPDITYAVHQCARFCSDPKVEHGKAVMWIGRYLLATRDKGMILKPNGESFDVSVDADFTGNWDSTEAASDCDTARSRHGYIITYAGCPITWASKLQTEVALSSTESEVIGLSEALRATIPLMDLLKELKGEGYPIADTIPKIHCKVYEDNSGALEIATVFKLRPRTRHLNTRFHHFRQYAARGEIEILPIDTTMQTSDFLTKPVELEILLRHRLTVMGW